MPILISTLNLIFMSVARFTEIYIVLILLRLSLGWLPNINAYNEPYFTLYRLTDPYLKLFRGILPYIFGMDVSPILAILFLQNIMVICQNIHLEAFD